MTWEAKPIAYVEWTDAALITGRWEDEADALEEAADTAARAVRSAGFLIGSTDAYIVIAAGRNPNNDDAHGVFMIPRANIKRLVLLDPLGGQA